MKSNIELMKYMLQDIRKVTLKGVSGLSKEQLFSEPVRGEYCIGAYLMHLAEADLGWLRVLDGNDVDEDLKRRSYYSAWFDSGTDENPPIKPIETDEYVDVITKCREKLLAHIDTLKDGDLDGYVTTKRIRDGKEITKQYLRKWIIYHLIEHEAHTRGQIFLLMRMAGFKKKGENN